MFANLLQLISGKLPQTYEKCFRGGSYRHPKDAAQPPGRAVAAHYRLGVHRHRKRPLVVWAIHRWHVPFNPLLGHRTHRDVRRTLHRHSFVVRIIDCAGFRPSPTMLKFAGHDALTLLKPILVLAIALLEQFWRTSQSKRTIYLCLTSPVFAVPTLKWVASSISGRMLDKIRLHAAGPAASRVCRQPR